MISTRQLGIIVALSRVSVITVFLPVITAADARQDAPIAAVVSTLGGVLLTLPAVALAVRFPGTSYGGFARRVLGKPLGILASVLLAGFFLVLVVLRARQLAFLLIASQLELAPSWIFAGTVVLVGGYGASLGGDSLGRMAEILLTLVVGSIVVGLSLAFLSVPIDFRYLRPIMHRGWGPVLYASLNPIFWFVTSGSVVLALSAYCPDHRRIPRAVMAAIVGSGVVLVAMAIGATIIFGPEKAQGQLSPALSLARIVFVHGVIERMDALLMSVWVAGVTFDAALFTLVSVVTLSDATRISPKYVLIAIVSIGFILAVQRFVDIFLIRRLVDPVYTTWAAVLVHVLMVGGTLLVAVITGRRGAGNDDSSK